MRRFSRVAGWFHMLVFIVGARTTGPVNARYVVVRKSLAKPCANLARRSAVAGATTSRSFCCATRMCSIQLGSVSSLLPDEQRLVMALCSVHAAEVSGGMD